MRIGLPTQMVLLEKWKVGTMESLEGRAWEKFSCTVEYESGKWHLSPESVLHEMGFRIFSPAIKSVYPYISSAFFSHYFRVSGRFCERWPIIRLMVLEMVFASMPLGTIRAMRTVA